MNETFSENTLNHKKMYKIKLRNIYKFMLNMTKM